MRSKHLIVLVFLLSGRAQSQNLVVNGGFESGLTGWTLFRFDEPRTVHFFQPKVNFLGNLEL